MTRIAACAISKNESDRVLSWVTNMRACDDLIVLDTGSTDDTVEQLRRYNVKVFKKTFEVMDFAAARNAAMGYITSGCDWVVSTDFDETLDADWRLKFESLLANNPDCTAVCCSPILNYTDGVYRNTYAESKKKFYKNGLYTWQSPVHEHLEPISQNHHKEITGDISLQHNWTTATLTANKSNRYPELCEHWIKVYPDDPILLWHMLQIAITQKDDSKVIDYGSRYLNNTSARTDLRASTFNVVASALFNSNADLSIITHLVISMYTEMPSNETIFNMLSFALTTNQTELALFAMSLIKELPEEYKDIRTHLLKNIK